MGKKDSIIDESHENMDIDSDLDKDDENYSKKYNYPKEKKYKI